MPTGRPATLTQYDAGGKPLVQTVLNEDRNGQPWNRVTYTFYDHLNRPTAVVADLDGDGAGMTPGAWVDDPTTVTFDASDSVTRTRYDGAGHVRFVTDALNHTTETRYDGAGRAVQTILPAVDLYLPEGGGLVSDYVASTYTTYDAASHPVLTTDASGNQTQYTYDALGRVTRTILDLDGDELFETVQASDADDIVTTSGYDLVGNQVVTTNPNGNQADSEYDFANRLTTVTGAEVADGEHGGVLARPTTSTVYDKTGKVWFVTDPRGIVTETQYDELGRARFVIANSEASAGSADRLVTESRYDANGNVTAVVLHNWVDSQEQDQTTTYHFDAFDRQDQQTLPDVGDNETRQSSTVWSRAGDVLTVIDPVGQRVESDYDHAGRVVSQAFKRADASVEETRVSFYDLLGRLTARLDKNGSSTYEYDALGRTTTESRTNTVPGSWTATASPASTIRTATARRWCIRRRAGRSSAGMMRPGGWCRLDDQVTGEPTRTTTFGYDSAGNRTSELADNDVLTEATFDALNRVESLISTTDGGQGDQVYSIEYGYDLAGNRIFATEQDFIGQSQRQLTWDYDDLYRLTEESWTGPEAADSQLQLRPGREPAGDGGDALGPGLDHDDV